MGVVFTRSFNDSDGEQSMPEDLGRLITEAIGVNASKMPVWQVDSHPEVLWGRYPDILASKVAHNQRTVQAIREWASTIRPVDVTKAFPSENENNKRAREARERAAELAAELDALYAAEIERKRVLTYLTLPIVGPIIAYYMTSSRR
eukprot:scaffold8686_cov201-Ochromonas_danica.AAC.1